MDQAQQPVRVIVNHVWECPSGHKVGERYTACSLCDDMSSFGERMRKQFEKGKRNIYARPSNSTKNKTPSAIQRLEEKEKRLTSPHVTDGKREAREFAHGAIPEEKKVPRQTVCSTDETSESYRRYLKEAEAWARQHRGNVSLGD